MDSKPLVIFLMAMAIVTSFYAVEKIEVSIKNGNTTLKGRIYKPKGDGPFPAIVFVHGSGLETKENSSYSSKWLASIGYVALAYDKRGAGESEGTEEDWRRFSFEVLATDVLAAVNFLESQNFVDTEKIGLHASSQGGWVAPLAVSKSKLISFVIMKSTSVTTVEVDRLFERGTRLMEEGFTEDQIMEAKEMYQTEPKRDQNREDQFTKLFEENKNKAWFSRVYAGDSPFTESLTKYRRWYATISNYDPVPLLKAISVPVFWIFGDPDLDHYAPIKESLQNVKELKKEGKKYEILQIVGQGHNIKERAYERALYEWLRETNDYRKVKFKKH